MDLYAADFFLLELRDPNLFNHDNAPVHKAKLHKATWFAVEELESPDLNSTEHFKMNVTTDLFTRQWPDLTYALMVEWTQMPS